MMKRLTKMKTWILFAAIFAMIAGPGIARWASSHGTDASAVSPTGPHHDQPADSATTALNKDKNVDRRQLSYALGVTIGHNLREDKIPIDADAFVTGLKAVLDAKPLKYTDQEMADTLSRFEQQRMEQHFAR
jgi:hypothetical protein